MKKAHVVHAKRVRYKPMRRGSTEKWVKAMEEGMYFAPVYIAIAGYVDLRGGLS